MPYLKFSNVNFYTGGSKVGRRIRHNQNYRIWVDVGHRWLEYPEQELINLLPWITKGRVTPTSSTAVKITQYSNYEWTAKVLRRRAMKWWNRLETESKAKFAEFYYSARLEWTLTGREIEGMFCREVLYKQRVPFI